MVTCSDKQLCTGVHSKKGKYFVGQGANKNKPCLCGSGRKFKRCCFGRKPVTETVMFDYGKSVKINDYRFHDGKLELMQDGIPKAPQRALVSSHRKANKKEKILLRIPVDTNETYFGEARALQQYDRIFAIDTNSKCIKGKQISVGCFAECRFNTQGNEKIFEIAILGAAEFHGVYDKQENLAWHILIKAIQASPDYLSQNSYGIITDSDLGNHTKYNDRIVPYFQKKFMPSNMTLNYAFDKGRSLCGRAIKRCDQSANKIIESFENGELSLEGASEVRSGVCSHFRGWLNINEGVDLTEWFLIKEIPHDTLD